MIVTGEDEVHGRAVGAHPFCGHTARFTRADIPKVRVECGSPWTPWLGRVVDGKAAAKARVFAGDNLAPEVTFKSGDVANCGTVAGTGIRKYGTARGDVASPLWLAARIDLCEELPGVALAHFLHRR